MAEAVCGLCPNAASAPVHVLSCGHSLCNACRESRPAKPSSAEDHITESEQHRRAVRVALCPKCAGAVDEKTSTPAGAPAPVAVTETSRVTPKLQVILVSDVPAASPSARIGEKEEMLIQEQTALLNRVNPPPHSVIALNVGGQRMYTTQHTLCKQRGSLLAALFGSTVRPLQKQADGFVFIDRNPEAFAYVLEWLRSGVIPPDLDSRQTSLVQAEARFWQLGDLVSNMAAHRAHLSHPPHSPRPLSPTSHTDTLSAIPSEPSTRRAAIMSGNYIGFLLANPRPFVFPQEFSSLSNWLLGKWVEVYRASRCGFASREFHSMCGGKGEAVVIYQDKGGYVFGGYSSTGWPEQNTHTDVTDERAFLFTLVNPHFIPPTIFPVQNAAHAISTDPIFGPSFGQGDVFSPHNAHINAGSFDFPRDYIDTTEKGKLLFTGSALWNAKDIIVFVRPVHPH